MFLKHKKYPYWSIQYPTITNKIQNTRTAEKLIIKIKNQQQTLNLQISKLSFINSTFIMRPFTLRGHEKPLKEVKFNYDGDLLFTGAAENRINVWESYTGERLGSYTTKTAVKTLDIDDNSQYLICGGLDGKFQIFKVQTGEQLMLIAFPIKCKYLQFNLGDSSFICLQERFKVGEANIVQIFDFKKLVGSKQKEINMQIDDTKLTPAQKNLVVPLQKFLTVDKQGNNKVISKISWYINNNGFFATTIDGYVIRYDKEGWPRMEIKAHEGEIKSFNFSKDYSIIVTAAVNGCKVFDPETLETIRYFKTELPMNTVSISPLFCSDSNPKYHLIMGGGIPARQTAMTAGNAGYEIHLMNIMFQKEIGFITGHYGPINSLDFFPDGRGFASGGQQGVIRVFRFDNSYWDSPVFE